MSGEMKIEKKSMKITLDGKELTGHQRLIDLGLEDGMSIGINLAHHKVTYEGQSHKNQGHNNKPDTQATNQVKI